jgi:membrane protein implicated in regulation of membrane protease activity
MSWWHWVVAGFVLLVVEMLTPGGLFALFFGIAAFAVGILSAVGLGGPSWLQWTLFAVLSLLLVGFLRRRLRGSTAARGAPVDTVVGESAVLLEELPPRGVAKAELRGSTWNARSEAEGALARGQRCRVVRVEGVTLWLRPE